MIILRKFAIPTNVYILGTFYKKDNQYESTFMITDDYSSIKVKSNIGETYFDTDGHVTIKGSD